MTPLHAGTELWVCVRAGSHPASTKVKPMSVIQSRLPRPLKKQGRTTHDGETIQLTGDDPEKNLKPIVTTRSLRGPREARDDVP